MMTTQRALEPHEFVAYAEASEICRHCDRGRYAAIHESVTLTTATDNSAEGDQRVEWILRSSGNIVRKKGEHEHNVATLCHSDIETWEHGKEIVKACNGYNEWEFHRAGLIEAVQTGEVDAHNSQRIQQLEQIIRDQMSVLRDWRGADNVPQQVRDAIAIRLTELRRVVEGK